jgi:hypothetical protein
MDVIQMPPIALFLSMLTSFTLAMLYVTVGDAIRH